MKLFVLRHGETNENITGMMQGDMDTVLNEKGCCQALSVRDKVLESNIDLVISSFNKSILENLISILVGCTFTSIKIGSTSIFNTTIGYLLSGI